MRIQNVYPHLYQQKCAADRVPCKLRAWLAIQERVKCLLAGHPHFGSMCLSWWCTGLGAQNKIYFAHGRKKLERDHWPGRSASPSVDADPCRYKADLGRFVGVSIQNVHRQLYLQKRAVDVKQLSVDLQGTLRLRSTRHLNTPCRNMALDAHSLTFKHVFYVMLNQGLIPFSRGFQTPGCNPGLGHGVSGPGSWCCSGAR